MFVPTPVQPPESPRVRELSQRVQELIRDFQRQYPMTSTEIRQALQHASGASGGDRRALVAAMAAGVAGALGVGLFVARGGGDASAIPMVVLVAVLAAVAGLVVAIRRNR